MTTKCLKNSICYKGHGARKLKMTNCIRAAARQQRQQQQQQQIANNNRARMTAKMTGQSVQKVSNNFGSRRHICERVYVCERQQQKTRANKSMLGASVWLANTLFNLLRLLWQHISLAWRAKNINKLVATLWGIHKMQLASLMLKYWPRV